MISIFNFGKQSFLSRKWRERIARFSFCAGLFFAIVCLFSLLKYKEDIYAYFFFNPVKTTGLIRDMSVMPSQSSRIKGYSYNILYEYRVRGVLHKSTRLSFDYGTLFKRREEAEQKLESYKIGQNVDVFYDKKFVGLSVLKISFDNNLVIMPLKLFLTSLLFLLGFAWSNKNLNASTLS